MKYFCFRFAPAIAAASLLWLPHWSCSLSFADGFFPGIGVFNDSRTVLIWNFPGSPFQLACDFMTSFKWECCSDKQEAVCISNDN